MTGAVGPVPAGGFQVVKAGAYELMFLPDLRNDELQREGKPPVYYWMPHTVRLARERVDTGPAKFHMVHFVGVQSSDTTVGVTGGTREVAGGLVTFSTTAAPLAGELEAAQADLLNRFRGSSDKFWGLAHTGRTGVPADDGGGVPNQCQQRFEAAERDGAVAARAHQPAHRARRQRRPIGKPRSVVHQSARARRGQHQPAR